MNTILSRPRAGAGFPASPIVPIHEAKTTLSRLVRRVAAGETIYIGAYGRPEAVLAPVNTEALQAALRKKAFGCMEGKLTLPEGWEAPLSGEALEAFYDIKGLEDCIHPQGTPD